MPHPAPRGRLDLSSRVSGPVTYERRKDRYCRFRTWINADDKERYVYVHQLVAIAEGADPAEVFSDGEFSVHHRNGCRFDNRAANLETLRHSEHFGEHHAADHAEKSVQVRADGGER